MHSLVTGKNIKKKKDSEGTKLICWLAEVPESTWETYGTTLIQNQLKIYEEAYILSVKRYTIQIGLN